MPARPWGCFLKLVGYRAGRVKWRCGWEEGPKEFPLVSVEKWMAMSLAMFQSSPGLEIQGSNQGEKISILSSSGSVRIGSSAASELPPL